MPAEMTLRDNFAAAALTGLLAQGDDGSFSEESYARAAYRWADAMLRERGNQPKPPDSSTLTDAERVAVRVARDAYADDDGNAECEEIAAVLSGLLERTK